MRPRFSILVVCLNPGDKLNKTLKSIEMQQYRDYEVVIKDGLSTDDALKGIEARLEEAKERAEILPEKTVGQHGAESSSAEEQWTAEFAGKIRVISRQDKGIYDAMNQAVVESEGEYLYFLNCGDVFADEHVLKNMAQFMIEHPVKKAIYYGNIYERLTGQVVTSNPKMDEFGCYRNVPCHQACFYERELLLAHPFKLKYKVRADYEQFLWCFFKGGAETLFAGQLIADYEGGGFSETAENEKLSAKEHKEIVSLYMSRSQIFKYKMILLLSLAPLRTRLARSEKTAKLYNKLKDLLYRSRKGPAKER